MRRARRLLTDPSGATSRSRRSRAQRRDASACDAPLVIVSCGAVNSAALLLRSASDKHPAGLANSSGLVGTPLHGAPGDDDAGVPSAAEELDGVSEDGGDQRFLPARAEDRYPLGQIQSQGRTHGVMAQTVVPWIPLWAYEAWVSRGVDWLVMSEDLPAAANRVTVDRRRPHPAALPAEQPEAHRRLVAENKRILRRLGFWLVVTHSHGSTNTTHQCGTLCFGTDPARVGSRSVTAARTMWKISSSSTRRSSRRRQP